MPTFRMARARAALPVLLLMAAGAACGPRLRRLDDAPIHTSPTLRLRLVRYYENLPLHYTGEIYVVQCASDATRDAPAGATSDAGWVALGRGGAIGSERAADLVASQRERYHVLGARLLVWTGTVLKVSFDGCGSFATWDPTTLGADAILPAPKPDFCAPVGAGDCRYMDFEGDRAPRYEEIVATEGGAITFRISSKAFRRAAALRVSSEDGGTTWTVAEIAPPAP
jgi:hypothetical protein